MLLVKYVDFDHRQILRIFLLTQFICLVPFFTTSLVIINIVNDQCMLANTSCDPKTGSCFLFGILTLGQWLAMDAYIKIAVYVFAIFMLRLELEAKCGNILVSTCGLVLRFFYLFEIGWTIYASNLFWGTNIYNYPTYQKCKAPLQGYLFSLLIITYIFIPINLYISSFRSSKDKEESLPSTTRRDTEMM